MCRHLSIVLCLLSLSSCPLFGADVLTLGRIEARAGSVAEVPILLRDVSGTALGSDAAPIQALALRVVAEPKEAVQSLSLKRAGVTARLQPQFEHSQKAENGAIYLVSFNARKARLVLRLDPDDGGDEIGRIVVSLSPDLAAGTVIRLSIDPTTAILSDEGGTVSEQSGDGTLHLTDGAIVIR